MKEKLNNHSSHRLIEKEKKLKWLDYYIASRAVMEKIEQMEKIDSKIWQARFDIVGLPNTLKRLEEIVKESKDKVRNSGKIDITKSAREYRNWKIYFEGEKIKLEKGKRRLRVYRGLKKKWFEKNTLDVLLNEKAVYDKGHEEIEISKSTKLELMDLSLYDLILRKLPIENQLTTLKQ